MHPFLPSIVMRAVRRLTVAAVCASALLCVRPAVGYRYPFTTFSDLQGLAVNVMVQDSRGRIWLGTDTGVWYWHGRNFQELQVELALGLVLDLAINNNDTLWIATTKGLWALGLDDLKLRHPGPVLYCCASLHVDSSGRLFAGTTCSANGFRGPGGLYEIAITAGFPTATCIDAVSGGEVTSITETQQGTLLLGKTNTITELSVDRTYERPAPVLDRVGGLTPNTNGHAYHVLQASDGAYWLGTRHPGRLIRITEDAVYRFGADDGLLSVEVNNILEAPNGDIWVATEGGVCRWAHGSFEHIGAEQGLPSTDVHALLIDREEQIWIGTYGNGAVVLPSVGIVHWGQADGLGHAIVKSLMLQEDGSLLIGTVAGLHTLDMDTSQIRTIVPDVNVCSLSAGSDQNTWVCAKSFFFNLEDQESIPIDSGWITSSSESNSGNLLLGTWTGLFSFDGHELSKMPGLPCESQNARCSVLAFHHENGIVHVGANGRLGRLESDRWTHVGCADNNIRSITTDAFGTHFVTTSDGLRAIAEGTTERVDWPLFRTAKFTCARIAISGELWAGTSEGVLRHDDLGVSRLSFADGLPSNDVRTIVLDADHTLYVGTSAGLARVDLRSWSPCPAAPLIRIREWNVGEAYGHSAKQWIDTTESDTTVIVGLHCVGWRSATGVQYRYRLTDLQESWSEWSPSDSLRFAELPAGRYTLEAQARNDQGRISESTASLRFRVHPALWKHPGVLALLAVIGVMLVTFLALRRFRQLRFDRERRRSEAILRESEARYRGLVESQRDLIVRFDATGRLVFVNDAFSETFGKRPAELIGSSFLAYSHSDDREQLHEALNRVRCDAGRTQTESRIYTTGGWRWIAWENGAIRNADGRVTEIQAVGRDFTARVEAAEELQRRQTELAHVARVGMMGELAASLAHELNQPLAAMANFAHGSMRRIETGDHNVAHLTQALRMISNQAARAGEIIRRTRSFVSNGSTSRRPTSINKVIHQALELVAADAKKRRVEINLELSEDAGVVSVDSIQIAQVVINLLLNAIEAVENVPIHQRSVTVRTQRTVDHRAQVSVIDTGPGIAPEALPRMFNTFYTTKAKGMGMGLAISKSIIEQHGGRLWTDSNAAPGARFHFWIQRSEAS